MLAPKSKGNFKCCDMDGPHLHLFRENGEKSIPIETKFRTTFFLQDGFSTPKLWSEGEKYIEDDLVSYIAGTFHKTEDSLIPITAEAAETIWRCKKETETTPCNGEFWEAWALKRDWKDRWGKYLEYSAGNIVYLSSGLYKCIKDSPAGVRPDESLIVDTRDHQSTTLTENVGRWMFLGPMGKKFPPWMNSPTTFTADLDFGKATCIHPSTGGMFWELPSEHFIGYEVMSVDREHSTVQKLFRDHGEDTVTKIYTAKIIHCGTCTPTKTEDDPKPANQNFFGITIGAYIIPPKKYAPDGTDNCGIPGCETCCGESTGSTEGVPDFQNILPMVSPQTGEPFSVIYLQWQAAEMPFIMQSLEDETSILNAMLCFSNREPHDHYMKLFENAAAVAHHGNMIDTSAEVFKRWFINDCIRTGRSIPQENISAEYKKWTFGKMIERSASLSAADRLWKEANEKWVEWLWELRQISEKLQQQCDFIAQDHYGVARWINSGPGSCPYDSVKWEYVNSQGEVIIISLLHIQQELDLIDRIWSITEVAVGGLLTYYVHGIETKVAEIKSKLSYYKYKDAINNGKAPRVRKRNGRNRK